jgi:galactonate dehydratase
VSVSFVFIVVVGRFLHCNGVNPCGAAVGGFTEAMKVAGWCEAHYIDLMPHNPLGPVSTAACIHLGAAVPNFAYLEDNFSVDTMHSQWDSKVYTPDNQACVVGQNLRRADVYMDYHLCHIELRAGQVFPKLLMRETTIERHATLGYPVPTDPGLGIEINEEALIAQPPFKFWNPPFLRRKDGSLNNW